MSDMTAMRGRDETRDGAVPDMGQEEPDEPTTMRKGPSGAAGVLERGGLIVAPFLIAGLAALLAWYHHSLDLANAPRQQSSALDWSTKLRPQMFEHIQIAAASTALVIVIAVPLGILLTRPALRRIGPPVLTIANAGQALPAYGLLVLGLVIAGQGQLTVVYALTLYALFLFLI